MANIDIFERAKAEITTRRESARAEADGRAEILRSESAEIARIDAELSTTGLQLMKAACYLTAALATSKAASARWMLCL